MNSKRHNKGLCWISHEHRFIFLAIPKNASSTIRKSFKDSINFQIGNYFTILKENPDIMNYKMFTVLRNPLERFVSGYLEVCKRNEEPARSMNFYKMTDPYEKFLTFIYEVEKNTNFDEHIRTQNFYITKPNGEKFHIDYYLISKRLNIDFRNMCNDFNIQIDIQNHNVSTLNDKIGVFNMIDDSLRLRINKIYQQDWELYNERLAI